MPVLGIPPKNTPRKAHPGAPDVIQCVKTPASAGKATKRKYGTGAGLNGSQSSPTPPSSKPKRQKQGQSLPSTLFGTGPVVEVPSESKSPAEKRQSAEEILDRRLFETLRHVRIPRKASEASLTNELGEVTNSQPGSQSEARKTELRANKPLEVRLSQDKAGGKGARETTQQTSKRSSKATRGGAAKAETKPGKAKSRKVDNAGRKESSDGARQVNTKTKTANKGTRPPKSANGNQSDDDASLSSGNLAFEAWQDDMRKKFNGGKEQSKPAVSRARAVGLGTQPKRPTTSQESVDSFGDFASQPTLNVKAKPGMVDRSEVVKRKVVVKATAAKATGKKKGTKRAADGGAVENGPKASAPPERHWLDDSSDSDDEIPRERMAALKTDLRAVRPALIAILAGDIGSERDAIFRGPGNSKRELRTMVGKGPFSSAEFSLISRLLVRWFYQSAPTSEQHPQVLNYVMLVLFPEALLRLIQKERGCSLADAERIMRPYADDREDEALTSMLLVGNHLL